MIQHEIIPRQYTLDEGLVASAPAAKKTNADISVRLRSIDPGTDARFTFEAIRPNLFRTTFSTPSHPLPPHPSAPRPETSFGNVVPACTEMEKRKKIDLGPVSAVVEWSDAPVVSLYLDGNQKPLHRDLNFRSYATDATGVVHYTAYKRDTLHVGLGEKAAPMNLSNRHFQIAATDCFGYDVYHTDPMYKHIPLLINMTPKGCVAMFSTSHSRGTWAVGSEVDGLWGHYKVYRQAHGGLEEYLIVGRTIQDVVKTYADLVGYPLLVPRWSLGYIAGGMKYSMLDEPRACDAHLEFAAKLTEHDIPCSAFQMSSGYTVAETEPKTRNVFTWNRHRFPDPQKFLSSMHAEGIRLIGNIKPYLLSNHPAYRDLVEARALFTDPRTKATGIARLWSAGGGESGEGGHIDFTSKAGFKWWYQGVKELKEMGMDSMWNDNNEYCLSHDDWELALENHPLPADLFPVQSHIGLWGRAMQTELMGKASHDALVAAAPEARPFVLTRSATAGTMRYAASSWSGDNYTSWDGMKGANALSLNAGMSLLQSYGHDIGGFEGPQPSPELLLRWVQQGVYSPRFAINCFKTAPDNNLVGDVIEPWMYPSIIPNIRAIIKRRYEIIPYLYSLSLKSHSSAIPPQRWIGWGYESDPEVWKPELLSGETQYWLGDTLLIGGVYEAGVSTARVYLPRSSTARLSPSSSSDTEDNDDTTDLEEGYINLNAPHQHLPAGQWATISSPWETSIPLLAKIGGAIPIGKPHPTASSSPAESRSEFPSLVADDYRGVEIFPPKGSSSKGKVWENHWSEDDGLSAADKAGLGTFVLRYEAREDRVVVGFEKAKENTYVPAWRDLDVILPVGDVREVVCEVEKTVVEKVGKDERGRMVWKLRA